MIVLDVNVLAYLLIPGKLTRDAEQLLVEDPAWGRRCWSVCTGKSPTPRFNGGAMSFTTDELSRRPG